MTAPYDYRPIGAGPAGRWPDGRRLAVYLAIGVEDYRPGDGLVEDLLPGVPAPDLVNRSWRDYGNRVGAFRLFDRLTEFGIAPTVLLNTAVYESAPAVVEAARAIGAEIVGHGISNSDTLAGRAPADERAYLSSVAARITVAEGAPPGGWSSPWLAHTPNTIDLLASTGYRYLLDLRPDDRPVWLRTAGAPLLSIPYALELNDSTTVIGRQASATEFATMIVDEADELLATPSPEPLVMSIVLHSFISGVPFRLRALTRALAHLHGRRDEIWFTQPRHIHRAFAALQPADTAEEVLDGVTP